jgi:hypothetical protein
MISETNYKMISEIKSEQISKIIILLLLACCCLLLLLLLLLLGGIFW